MNDIDRAQRLTVAEAGRDLRMGRISRRRFLRICAEAGFVLGGARMLSGCRPDDPAVVNKQQIEATADDESASSAGSDEALFLKDMRGHFLGTKLVVIGEDTPPSMATIRLLEQEFTPITGIEVEWRLLPLDDVLVQISSATAREAGDADIFYVDASWLGRFVDDTVDPNTLFERSDFAYPNYDFKDILPTLVENLASYRGRMVGIPFDIPLAIMIYRRDIFEELNLSVPKTLAEYTAVVAAIQEEKGPAVYGTTGMWKAGHYALIGDAMPWIWAHGGSVYGADKRALIDDEYARAGLEYMSSLAQYMPPGSIGWDWNDAAKSFAQGQAGVYFNAGEWFSVFDDPARSKIVGLAEAAPCPQEIRLRAKDDCSFGETPGISRHGGSCMAISKYSKNIDAAWVFLQWATSFDVTTRANLLGGGSSPIRRKTYSDPRTMANAKVQVGTTRHLSVTLDAIENRMGSDPHLPGWEILAVNHIAVEIGRLLAGEQDVKTTVDILAKVANEFSAKA